ncbi:hypothetical protein [Halobellus limi]|uniref:Uncharacterized protein n=1 Tax=Halobellus limi TaxID=699433 RepID=A0A1H5VA26_9EURY|nr:hypothetical protein [Halobellus limi]QCC46775.1 hypothetical protein DV707_03325 [Halobellus limi]SEF84054.1 hypothetical protein SAMN04488133_0891 [Halobellus limi]
MADTKEGREKQAADEARRQRERALKEALARADEAEPAADERGEASGEEGDSLDLPLTCHRRNCDQPAEFLVLERYQEETGKGAVEATAALCRAHTDEESPTNLDGAYDEYVFRVVPLPESLRQESA